MLPITAFYNITYSPVRHTKLLANCGIRMSTKGIKATNFSHVFWHEFTRWIMNALLIRVCSIRQRMLCILFWCHPFQITQSVISTIKIFVIDVYHIYRFANESLQNKACNVIRVSLMIPIEAYIQVVIGMGDWLKNVPFRTNSPKQAFHSPLIANFIQSLESRDWFPILIHSAFLSAMGSIICRVRLLSNVLGVSKCKRRLI